MLIDKIKNIGSIFSSNKTAPVKQSAIVEAKDNIQISPDAKLKAEVASLTNYVLSLNSTNIEKINEVKSKLSSGFYDNLSDEVLTKTVEQMTKNTIERN